MKINILLLSAISLLTFSCGGKKSIDADYAIVPLPQSMKQSDGVPFVLNENTKIVYLDANDTLKQTAQFLSEYIELTTGLKLVVLGEQQSENAIVLKTGYEHSNAEAYSLLVNQATITVEGTSQAGVFYGVQTLRKSIPAMKEIAEVKFSPVEIKDYPRFSYRGMHLDVGRHVFPVESIKTYIDMLALHNINRFHWHLTDDQGWRIEIKKYPELTKIGSMRDQTDLGKKTGKYDGVSYGGFYTQEEIKEIVKYAEERFITIIPEVDLPGHMLAALATYPNLGCTGGPYKVAQTWGIFDDVLCAGNEEIYTFLEGVYEEVIDLFPSEYIHVGGDECPKTRWKECPKCQAKIRELGLKATDGHTKEEMLQSYVIQRIEKYINSKGRKIIGWDETLEGGIAPNATIMSWRGTEGGIAAARQHHDAIMTPSNYLYFDYYQSADVTSEPLSIGGLVPVEKVYSYEPVASELTDEEKKHIVGVQANLWTEYIKDFDHVQYMTLPRMGALSEVQWTMPEKKNYKEFLPRLSNMTKLYGLVGYNYAKHIFEVESTVEVNREQKNLKLTFSTFDGAPIYYTLDNSEPNEKSLLYKEPIIVDKSQTVKAVVIRDKQRSKVYEQSFDINKATFQTVELTNKPWAKYSYLDAGAPDLVDGLKGGEVYKSGRWVGFKDDFIATVDLKEPTEVSSVAIGAFVGMSSWIFNPQEYMVEVSEDNKTFKSVYSESFEVAQEGHQDGTMILNASFSTEKARYVRIIAKYFRTQPAWGGGPGKPAVMFIDEIVIN